MIERRAQVQLPRVPATSASTSAWCSCSMALPACWMSRQPGVLLAHANASVASSMGSLLQDCLSRASRRCRAGLMVVSRGALPRPLHLGPLLHPLPRSQVTASLDRVGHVEQASSHLTGFDARSAKKSYQSAEGSAQLEVKDRS